MKGTLAVTGDPNAGPTVRNAGAQPVTTAPGTPTAEAVERFDSC